MTVLWGRRSVRQTSGVTPLDMLIAHKVISLAEELTGNEKRVAAALIDSFNRRSGQCDPGLTRLANLLAVNRRTVIRAVNRLEKAHFILKIRHGGKSHRNRYLPNWKLMLEREDQWRQRMKLRKTMATNESPLPGQSSHLAGAKADTQTLPINQSKVTSGVSRAFHNVSSQRSSGVDRSNPAPRTSQKGLRLSIGARAAAERRWSAELNERFASDLDTYAAILEVTDANVQAEATEAEIREHGAGLKVILANLQIRSRMMDLLVLGQKEDFGPVNVGVGGKRSEVGDGCPNSKGQTIPNGDSQQ